jgi:beta-lactamase regulating signal transducer with metallopeptidase domain
MQPYGPFFDTSLPVVGAWFTYFVQVVFAYALARSICALIPDPRLRLRVWGGVLFLVTAGWLYVCCSALRGTPVSYGSEVPVLGNYMRRSWSVDRSWSSQLGFTIWVWRLYLCIVALSLIDLLLKSARLAALLRTGRPPSPELDLLFRGLCCEMDLTRCTLLFVPELRSPATCGVWHARVLIPASLIPLLSSSQLADIMRHELTHVSQRDCLWDRLAALACRAIFFHPAVWFTRRRFRWERELACDQAVIEAGGEPVRYAECLTKLARCSGFAGTTTPNGIGFSSSSSQLTTRVSTLLRGPQSYSPLRQVTHFALVVFLASAGACALTSLSLTFHWPTTPTSPQARFRAAHAIAAKNRLARKPLAAAPQGSLTSGTPPSSEPANFKPTDLSLISTSPRLPVLKITPPETEDVGMQDEDNGSQHPAWDEPQVPGGPKSPNWQKVAVDAVVGAVGFAIPDEDSDDAPRPRTRAARPH